MKLYRKREGDTPKRPTWIIAGMIAGLLLAPLPAAVAGDKDVAESARDSAADVGMHLELETRLAASDAVSAFEIETDVKDGVAYLDGTVESSAEKELAAEIAESVEGVKSVRNDLDVADEGPGAVEKMRDAASDVAVTTAVKTRLLASGNTSGLAISVDTADGVVTLGGEVDSTAEKELAAAIAANTAGVSEVRNKIAVD